MKKRQLKLITNNGEEIPIDSFPFTLGSFKDYCSYWIDDQSVSPIHCQIIEDNGSYAIEDLNSRIGVLVNDIKISQGAHHLLKSDDTIKIDDIELKFVLMDRLFSQNEIKELNRNFKKILDESEDSRELATDIIDTLLDKTLEVSDLAFGDDQAFKSGIEKILPEISVATLESEETTEEVLESEPEVNTSDEVSEIYDTPSEINIPNSPSEEVSKPDVYVSFEEDTLSDSSFENNFSEPINENFAEPNQNSIYFEETIGSFSSFEEPPTSSDSRMVDVNPNLFNSPFDQPEISPEPVITPSVPYCVLREKNKPYESIRVMFTPFKIGRSSELCDYVLKRKGMSRSHATILRDEFKNTFSIRDNNAVNGTYLNGRKLEGESAELNVGDTVKFYDYEFTVVEIG